MSDKPRYSRIADILELAIFMQTKYDGITISDIQNRFKVSRRTAERMRDSLLAVFPQIEEIDSDDALKHWGFKNYSLSTLIDITPNEIANLQQLVKRTTNKEFKTELQKTIDKILALNNKKNLQSQAQIELFLQTEGFAVSQMPQYKIDLSALQTIREAMHFSKKVTGIYHGKKRIIEPLGLIYGEKIYLIAREAAKGEGVFNYILHKFTSVKIADEPFEKGDFNLQEYTNQSFGVFHGKILNVVLHFSKELAKDAKEYNFHPTQKIEEQDDGTVLVSFKACGNKEIIWHVFKWGKGCKILEPASLQKDYQKMLAENLENYTSM